MTDFDFALGDTADMIRDTTYRFATDRIAPRAAAMARALHGDAILPATPGSP